MPTLTGSAPVLLVRNVVDSANYWRDRVGFHYDRLWGEPPCFCILERDGRHLMLNQAPDGTEIRPHWQVVDQLWNVYFWVDDVDSLYAELRERGAAIDYELHNKPYGCREFGIQDLDGHDIAFGQVL
jgi:uncharacterized glyoxalase superfamily protein PhnB